LKSESDVIDGAFAAMADDVAARDLLPLLRETWNGKAFDERALAAGLEALSEEEPNA
jgi:hypothetical protein